MSVGLRVGLNVERGKGSCTSNVPIEAIVLPVKLEIVVWKTILCINIRGQFFSPDDFLLGENGTEEPASDMVPNYNCKFELIIVNAHFYVLFISDF